MFIILYNGGYETCKNKSDIKNMVESLHDSSSFEDPSELIIYEVDKAYRVEQEYKVIPL